MLKALSEYYDCLRSQPDSGLVEDGYSKISVGFNIVLQKDGALKEILPYTQEKVFGKKVKTVGREELFPFRNSIPGIAAETIDHREKYLFGMEFDKESQALKVSKNSLNAFEKCKEVNSLFLRDIHTDLSEAYKAFMQKWDPREQTENPLLKAMGKEYAGAKFVITLVGAETQPLNRQPEVKQKWELYQQAAAEDKNAVMGQCAVCGEILPIARTHNGISGISGGLATGVNLVCFNNTAFESYGKKQSFNSSISVEVMKKYTKALNYLTSSATHKQMLDDMTLLFWANTKTSEKFYIDSFLYGVFPTAENSDNEVLKSVFEKLSQGKNAEIEGVDFSADFYVLGVKPNSSRLAVKIFEKNAFGEMLKNVAKHCADMKFDAEDKQLSVWQIDKALKSPNSSDNINPELPSKLLVSILKGMPYPQYMLDTAVRRCRTDHDDPKKGFFAVGRTRARIIRACLLRKKYIQEGEYVMLQENSTDTAYNLGRLFAVLEKTQKDALGDINATIKDKFFSSACATPYLVFPRLLKLTQAHLAKLDEGNKIFKEKLIQEIMAKLEGSFPKALNMDKQGMFMLGYYQQRQKFYEKNNKGEE